VTEPFTPFTDVLMLRLDIGDPTDRTYYVTPFVSDGTFLYIFDEPIAVTSRATEDLVVHARCRRPSAVEEKWARDACSARFFYDQALQDLAQLGSIVVAEPFS
jgi:hypothetical protein